MGQRGIGARKVRAGDKVIAFAVYRMRSGDDLGGIGLEQGCSVEFGRLVKIRWGRRSGRNTLARLDSHYGSFWPWMLGAGSWMWRWSGSPVRVVAVAAGISMY